MNWLINRLREASTWRGLVWLLTVSGVALRSDQIEAIVIAGMALAGLIGVFVRDEIRSPETRTRETDLPPVDLVGRSESNPPVLRVRTATLQPNNEPQDPGSTLRQDGSGYNG